jgi:hypothetical protein
MVMKAVCKDDLIDLYKNWSDLILLKAATIDGDQYEEMAHALMLDEIKARGLSLSALDDPDYELKQFLENLKMMVPDVFLSIENNAIIFEPVSDDGFPVEISGDGDEFMIACDFWHVHISGMDNAINLFLTMLSDSCKMRLEFRGDVLYKMDLEISEDERFGRLPESIILNLPIGEKRIEYLQNDVFKHPISRTP